MEESLVALINDAASTWPFGPYVLGKTDSGWKAHSFSQTRDRARAFAAWLLHRGFSPGQKGAILGEGSPEWVQGEFGLLTAGLVSVPLSAKLTGQELSYRLVHSESAILLVSSNLFDRAVAALAESAAEKAHAGLDKDSPRDFGAGKAPPCISDSHAPILVCLDSGQSRERLGEKMEAAGFGSENLFFFSQAAEAGEAALRDSPEAAIRLDSIATEMRADSLAFICYTSGTSDNPKAVMLSHRNIRANSHDAFVQFHTPRYKTLIVLPADHAFIHTVAIFTALWCGVALYFLDSRGGTMAGIRNIAGNIQECQPDFMLTVPALSANIQKRIIAGVRARGPLISRLFEAGIKAEIEGLGDGFSWKSKDLEHSAELARAGWQKARAAILDGAHFLVVLDEITYPLIYGWLPLEDVLQTLRERPKDVHVCLTGRRCPPELIALADTVTEMTLVKHAFKAGVPAQRGIED